MCKLQTFVSEWVFGHRHAADCFCGEGGFWPLREADSYKNDLKSVEFIEHAVRQAVERHVLDSKKAASTS
jgi:hypothetical protein